MGGHSCDAAAAAAVIDYLVIDYRRCPAQVLALTGGIWLGIAAELSVVLQV
jgi:hypothetical protein